MKEEITPIERKDYADHPLITPCDASLLDYYASLISEHHLPLSAMFDEDSQNARHHRSLVYFPQSYAPYIPSWGVVYYHWRKNGEDGFIDTIREVEDEVLSSSSLTQSLQEEDPTLLKVQTTKYELIKKHYNTPAKTTSLRNRSINNALSHLSNEGLTALIASIERATASDVPSITQSDTTLDTIAPIALASDPSTPSRPDTTTDHSPDTTTPTPAITEANL